MAIWFLPAFTLLFVALKLTNLVGWSWLWILAPLWLIPLAMFLAALVAFIVGAIIVHFYS